VPAEGKVVEKAGHELGIDPQLLLGAATPVVKHLMAIAADEPKETVEPLIREEVRRLFWHQRIERDADARALVGVGYGTTGTGQLGGIASTDWVRQRQIRSARADDLCATRRHRCPA